MIITNFHKLRIVGNVAPCITIGKVGDEVQLCASRDALETLRRHIDEFLIHTDPSANYEEKLACETIHRPV